MMFMDRIPTLCSGMTLVNSPKRPGRTQALGGFLAQLPLMLDERVRRRLDQARVLDAALKRHLPGRLVGHCWVADYLDGTLVVAVVSSVWATQLRFHTTTLRQALARECVPRITRVRICVLPQTSTAPTPLPPPTLSDAAARGIASAAADLTPGPLRDALLRLARRHQS
jgi:hypothetical protein